MAHNRVCRWNSFCHGFYALFATPLTFFIGQSVDHQATILVILFSIMWMVLSTGLFFLLSWLRGDRHE